MFNSDKPAGRLAAAAFAMVLSLTFFATAIVPASPNGVFA